MGCLPRVYREGNSLQEANKTDYWNVTFQMCANEVYWLFNCREWETFKLLLGEVLVWIWVLPHDLRSACVSCANVPSLLSLGRNSEDFEVLLIFRRTSAANGLCKHARSCKVIPLLSGACSVPLGFQDPWIQVQRQASCKKCTLVPTADNLVLVKSGVKCHTGASTVMFAWWRVAHRVTRISIKRWVGRNSKVFTVQLKGYFVIVSK